VYGSLVEPRRLDEVLGHGHAGERVCATLDGYQRVTVPSYEFPYIVEAGGRSVDGLLVMDLSAYDLQALDRYEEVDAGIYRRRIVEVRAWGCGTRPVRLKAYTYVAGPTLPGLTESASTAK
jgi:hypothetical protein